VKKAITIVVGVGLIVALIYGAYWLAKTVSYAVFYEDMVIETIRNTVNQRYLN